MIKDGHETKLSFLQNELRLLLDENQELKHLLKLNKEVIRIQKDLPSVPLALNTRRSDTENARSDPEKGFQHLFHQLYLENQQLYKLVDQLTKQRDEARSQALIFEQIYEESTQKNIECQAEKQNELLELQSRLEQQQRIITDLYGHLADLQSKKKIKQKILISPSEEILVALNQINHMRQLIGRLVSENKVLKSEKKQLQLLLDVMNSNLKDGQPPSYIPSQNQSFEDVSPGDKKPKLVEDDSSFVDFLPQKVPPNAPPKSLGIPKLDLTKAQKIQKLNVQKQEEIDEKEELELKTLKLQQQVKINSKLQTPQSANTLNMFTSPNKLCIQLATLSDQNKLLQKELAICRQKLQDEILLTKTLEDELDDLQRRVQEVEHANEILTHSQLKYEQKWSKVSQNYQKYQEFYRINNEGLLDSPKNAQAGGSLLNTALTGTNKSHRKVNASQQVRDIAYNLYSLHQIEEKMQLIQQHAPSKRPRSLTN